MSFALVPLAEATLFTLGCMLIHAMRRQADVVTAALACLATLLVLMIGIACAPEPSTDTTTAGIADLSSRDPGVY